MSATYSCEICREPFSNPADRNRHEKRVHGHFAKTLAELETERETIMAEQGFGVGDRVTVLIDCAPGIPEHVRFHAGDIGEVVANHAHGPEVISVRFPASGTRMLHAIAPQHLRNESANCPA